TLKHGLEIIYAWLNNENIPFAQRLDVFSQYVNAHSEVDENTFLQGNLYDFVTELQCRIASGEYVHLSLIQYRYHLVNEDLTPTLSREEFNAIYLQRLNHFYQEYRIFSWIPP